MAGRDNKVHTGLGRSSCYAPEEDWSGDPKLMGGGCLESRPKYRAVKLARVVIVGEEDKKFFPMAQGNCKGILSLFRVWEEKLKPWARVKHGAGVPRQEINTQFCPSAAAENVKPLSRNSSNPGYMVLILQQRSPLIWAQNFKMKKKNTSRNNPS